MVFLNANILVWVKIYNSHHVANESAKKNTAMSAFLVENSSFNTIDPDVGEEKRGEQRGRKRLMSGGGCRAEGRDRQKLEEVGAEQSKV